MTRIESDCSNENSFLQETSGLDSLAARLDHGFTYGHCHTTCGSIDNKRKHMNKETDAGFHSEILNRFWEEPGGHIVLDENLHVVDVGPEYLRMTMSQRDDILGKDYINTITEPNPARHAQAVDSVRRLTAAALKTKQTQKYPTIRSDVKSAIDGSIQERWWRGAYIPVTVPTPDGEKVFIVHRIEDLTTENVLINKLERGLAGQRRSNYILYAAVILLSGISLFFYSVRSDDNRKLAVNTCKQVQDINARITATVTKEQTDINTPGTASFKFYQKNPELLKSANQQIADSVKTFKPKTCAA